MTELEQVNVRLEPVAAQLRANARSPEGAAFLIGKLEDEGRRIFLGGCHAKNLGGEAMCHTCRLYDARICDYVRPQDARMEANG